MPAVDFSEGKGTLTALLYGQGKIGKTRSVLDLTHKHGCYVVKVSCDGGDLFLYQNPGSFKKVKLFESHSLTDFRSDLAEARKTVKKIYAQKPNLGPEKVWFCLDTVTHAQNILLTEARRVAIGGRSHGKQGDQYQREMTEQADYSINLGHMNELANMIRAIPCNHVICALEKSDHHTGRKVPALSGQALNRYTGDADVVLRMDRAENGEGYFERFTGDRSGMLDAIEPADLVHIHEKMMRPSE